MCLLNTRRLSNSRRCETAELHKLMSCRKRVKFQIECVDLFSLSHLLSLTHTHTPTVSCFLPLYVSEKFVLRLKSFKIKPHDDKQTILRLVRLVLNARLSKCLFSFILMFLLFLMLLFWYHRPLSSCAAAIPPSDDASLTDLPFSLSFRGVLPPACDESTAASTRWRLRYDVYQYFLPENDLSQSSLFSALQSVADVGGIRQNGRRVPLAWAFSFVFFFF